jgi:rhomboid family GlyGly-CTERM serine protease
MPARRLLYWKDCAGLRVVPWLILLAVMTAIGFSGDALYQTLRYDRAAVRGGELWRLITAHLVHLGVGHLVMNLLALVLIGFLFAPFLKGVGWLASGLGAIAAIAAGLFFLAPQVGWYVGFSGVLHGLIAGGVIAALRSGEWRFGLGFGLLLLAKLLWEQRFGPLPGSEAAAGGAVLVDAHLYGALGGLPGGWWCAPGVRSGQGGGRA